MSKLRNLLLILDASSTVKLEEFEILTDKVSSGLVASSNTKKDKMCKGNTTCKGNTACSGNGTCNKNVSCGKNISCSGNGTCGKVEDIYC